MIFFLWWAMSAPLCPSLSVSLSLILILTQFRGQVGKAGNVGFFDGERDEPGQEIPDGQQGVLVDVSQRDEGLGALLLVLLEEAGLALVHVEIGDGDGADPAEVGQLVVAQRRHEARKLGDRRQVEDVPTRLQDHLHV